MYFQEKDGDTPNGKLAEVVCEHACQEFPGTQTRLSCLSARLGSIKRFGDVEEFNRVWYWDQVYVCV